MSSANRMIPKAWMLLGLFAVGCAGGDSGDGAGAGGADPGTTRDANVPRLDGATPLVDVGVDVDLGPAPDDGPVDPPSTPDEGVTPPTDDGVPPADAEPQVDAETTPDEGPPVEDAGPPVDAAAPDLGRLVINELDYAQAGADSTEFVELFNASDAPARLTGKVLELVNGSTGETYGAVDLGLWGRSLDAGAYLVVGVEAVLDGLPAGAPGILLDGQIQNGPADAVRLVDTAVVPPRIVDAIAYEGPLAGVGEGNPAPTDQDNGPGGLSRCENGVDTEDNAADFRPAVTSPGRENVCPPPGPTRVDVAVSAAQVATRAEFSLELTLDLDAPAGGLEFALSFEPETAAQGPAIAAFPEGEARLVVGPFIAGAQAQQARVRVATADSALVGEAEFEVVAAPPPAREPLVIDEVDIDQPGADTAEFIEILNPGRRAAPLAGLILEHVNNAGMVYASHALDSATSPEGAAIVTLGPGQRLVIGAPVVLDALGPETVAIELDGTLQNAAGNALRIVDALSPVRAVLDAVAFGADPMDVAEGAPTAVLDANAEVIFGLGRCPSGTDTDDNAADFGWGAPTPGAVNVCLPALTAVAAPSQVLPREAFTIEVEANRRAPAGGRPLGIVFDPVGPQCAANPSLPEGQRRVVIDCTAGAAGGVRHTIVVVAGADSARATLEVGQPPRPVLDLVIDEVDYDQPGVDLGEFVEVLNVGEAAPLDGVFLEIYDGAGRGLLGEVALDEAAAMLPAGARLVIGQPDLLATLPPGALSARLSAPLENGPDAVRIVVRNGAETEVLDAIAWEGSIVGQGEGRVSGLADQGADDEFALARCPGAPDTNDNANDLRLAPPSPGRASVCPAPLTASLTPAEVVVGGLTTLEVVLDVPAGVGGAAVEVSSAPANALATADALVVAEGARRARFDLVAQGPVGPTTVTVRANGAEVRLELRVSRAAGPRDQLVVNEVDYEQEGEDTAEFVEIFNGTADEVTLDGVVLELVNGSNGTAYATVDLAVAGETLASGAYLVIGAPALEATLPAGTAFLRLPAAIQNGAPDGLRLVDLNAGMTIDGIAYEGEMPGTGEGAPAPTDLGPLALARFPNGVDTDDNAADLRLRVASPGRENLDQAPLAASVNPVEVVAGAAFVLTVSLPSPAGGAGLDVQVTSAPAMAVRAEQALRVPAGERVADFAFTAGGAPGPVQLTVRAGGEVVVVDLSILPLPMAEGALVINELDYDQEGADSAEFIEIFNGTRANVPLEALELVFINGANGGAVDYRSELLADMPTMLRPGQYLVVGSAAALAGTAAGALQRTIAAEPALQNGAPDGLLLQDTVAGIVVDAIAYEGQIAGIGEGSAGPTDTGVGVLGLSRCPNGADTNDNGADLRPVALTKGAANDCGAP